MKHLHNPTWFRMHESCFFSVDHGRGQKTSIGDLLNKKGSQVVVSKFVFFFHPFLWGNDMKWSNEIIDMLKKTCWFIISHWFICTIHINTSGMNLTVNDHHAWQTGPFFTHLFYGTRESHGVVSTPDVLTKIPTRTEGRGWNLETSATVGWQMFRPWLTFI